VGSGTAQAVMSASEVWWAPASAGNIRGQIANDVAAPLRPSEQPPLLSTKCGPPPLQLEEGRVRHLRWMNIAGVLRDQLPPPSPGGRTPPSHNLQHVAKARSLNMERLHQYSRATVSSPVALPKRSNLAAIRLGCTSYRGNAETKNSFLNGSSADGDRRSAESHPTTARFFLDTQAEERLPLEHILILKGRPMEFPCK
jgi:hypothetical protein